MALHAVPELPGELWARIAEQVKHVPDLGGPGGPDDPEVIDLVSSESSDEEQEAVQNLLEEQEAVQKTLAALCQTCKFIRDSIVREVEDFHAVVAIAGNDDDEEEEDKRWRALASLARRVLGLTGTRLTLKGHTEFSARVVQLLEHEQVHVPDLHVHSSCNMDALARPLQPAWFSHVDRVELQLAGKRAYTLIWMVAAVIKPRNIMLVDEDCETEIGVAFQRQDVNIWCGGYAFRWGCPQPNVSQLSLSNSDHSLPNMDVSWVFPNVTTLSLDVASISTRSGHEGFTLRHLLHCKNALVDTNARIVLPRPFLPQHLEVLVLRWIRDAGDLPSWLFSSSVTHLMLVPTLMQGDSDDGEVLEVLDLQHVRELFPNVQHVGVLALALYNVTGIEDLQAGMVRRMGAFDDEEALRAVLQLLRM